MPLAARLLEILCCPTCHHALKEHPDAGGFECLSCHRIYPIVEGIPNFLVEDGAP